MHHSTLGTLLISIFWFSHIRLGHDRAFSILDRSFLMSRADSCVLKYLEKNRRGSNNQILPGLVERCALNQYFKLEKYGKIFNSFPVFKTHLHQCSKFIFIGKTDLEKEISNSHDFQYINCDLLTVVEKNRGTGSRNEIHVDHLTSKTVLKIIENSGFSILEHLIISEFLEDPIQMLEEILNFEKTLPCQITMRIPRNSENIDSFYLRVLKNEPYTLMNILETEKYIQIYLFASSNYHCMMRYF